MCKCRLWHVKPQIASLCISLIPEAELFVGEHGDENGTTILLEPNAIIDLFTNRTGNLQHLEEKFATLRTYVAEILSDMYDRHIDEKRKKYRQSLSNNTEDEIKEALYLLQKVVRVAEKVGVFSCALKLLPFYSSSST